jgi:hypothetical protein
LPDSALGGGPACDLGIALTVALQLARLRAALGGLSMLTLPPRIVTRKIHTLLLVLFAWMAIGADNCDGWGWSAGPTKNTPAPTPTPALPWCYTDPPQGCAVVCTDPTLPPAPNGCCSNPAADVLTMQFLMHVQNAEAQAESATGMTLCSLHPNAIVAPCNDGILPVEWPNQDHASCMPAPAGCTVGCP